MRPVYSYVELVPCQRAGMRSVDAFVCLLLPALSEPVGGGRRRLCCSCLAAVGCCCCSYVGETVPARWLWVILCLHGRFVRLVRYAHLRSLWIRHGGAFAWVYFVPYFFRSVLSSLVAVALCAHPSLFLLCRSFFVFLPCVRLVVPLAVCCFGLFFLSSFSFSRPRSARGLTAHWVLGEPSPNSSNS